MSELHYLSATRAREMFASRELSPVELMDAVIARAERIEPTVNAFCHRYYERARGQAKAAEARYAGNGEPPRPLRACRSASRTRSRSWESRCRCPR